jgi:hypothetical protein
VTPVAAATMEIDRTDSSMREVSCQQCSEVRIRGGGSAISAVVDEQNSALDGEKRVELVETNRFGVYSKV